MTLPNRKDIWLVDLGMVAKIRPCLVISVPADDEHDRVLVTLIPHTTSRRGSRFEVCVPVRFLKAGAFDCQSLVTIPTVKLIRKLGTLGEEEFVSVIEVLKRWLGIDSHS